METYYTPPQTRHARVIAWTYNRCHFMSILGISSVLLLASAGLLVSEGSQAMIAGGVMAGAVMGGLGKTAHSMLSKKDVPKGVMLVHFLFHVGIGWPVGCMLMIWYLQNFTADFLVLRSIVSGGAGAFFGHQLAKSPFVRKILEDRGLIQPRDQKPKDPPAPAPTTKLID